MSLFSRNKPAQQGQPQQPTPEQLQQMHQSVQAVKASPASFLHDNFGVDVPQGTNDPFQIMDHLARSGQLNQRQMQMLNQVRRMQGARR